MTMTTSPNSIVTLADLQACLPADWHATLNELAASTLQATTPLKLSLVGAFSVGKSSLLNMLMNDPVLQASLEETTALPTFIEHGPQRAMQLVDQDGRITPLDDPAFARVTTHAPQGAACAVLQQPLAWLQGVCIIDLPGTGSMSSSNRDFTLTQIRQSDAVLYLLNPNGPSAKDIELLTEIRQNAKQVKIVVTRWDVVEASVAKGEKAPSLEAWAAEIHRQTGLKRRLAPVSKDGLGREEIIDFIVRTRDDLSTIRQKRFLAEVRPMLENALGQNAELQRACEAQSEVEASKLHGELLAKRQALMELKSALYEEATRERAKVDAEAAALIGSERQALQNQLEQHAAAVQQASQWGDFEHKGARTVRESLSKIAQTLSQQSADYGRLSLSASQVESLNLRLPAVESVSVDDFLDMGRMTQLQLTLAAKENEAAEKSRALANLPQVDLSQQEQSMRELNEAQRSIASAALPTVQVPAQASGGAVLGRVLGEVADIGLMFLNPAFVGAKLASLVGKGAKVAGIAVNARKLAQTIGAGVRTLQENQSRGNPVITTQQRSPHEKVNWLEQLSLGYWGEKLGSTLGGGGPKTQTMVDPEALAQQQQALAEIEAHRRALQVELTRAQDIADERELTGWALEQNNKEQAQLRAELEAQHQKAEQKKLDFERMAAAEQNEAVRRYSARAVEQWMRQFDQQTTGMTELLHTRVKHFWEDRVDARVQERMAEVDDVAAQLQSAPDHKRAALEQLQTRAQAMQQALKGLHS